MILLHTFFLLALLSLGDALTPDNCEIDTSGNRDGDYTFLITVTENPNGVTDTVLTINNVDIPLNLIKRIPTYVKITVGAMDRLDCNFVGDGVVLVNHISQANDAIVIRREGSAKMMIGSRRLTVTHDKDNRDVVPLNIKVLKGAAITATLRLIDVTNVAVNPIVTLKEKASNLILIPKQLLNAAGATFEVVLELREGGEVIVENKGATATLKLGEESSLTCFMEKCDVEVEKNGNVLFKTTLSSDPSRDNPKLKVGSNNPYTIPLETDVVYVVKEENDEIPASLKLTFESDLNQNNLPPTFNFINLDLEKDQLMLDHSNVVLRGRPMFGALKFTDTPQSLLTLELLSPAKKCQFTFSINNPHANHPGDLKKILDLNPQKLVSKMIFFKDQVDTHRLSMFKFTTPNNDRVIIRMKREEKVVKVVIAGSRNSLINTDMAIIRKPADDKNITLVLKLRPESKVDKSKVRIGEEEIEVEKKDKYYFIYHESFQKPLDLIFQVLQDDAVLEYTLFNQIVPLPIVKGKQIFTQLGKFNLEIENPNSGVTLKFKGTSNQPSDINFNLELNRMQSENNKMELKRRTNGKLEEVIFIYPEDINGVDVLHGSFRFDKTENLFVENIAGIEPVTYSTGTYLVRRNTGVLLIKKPNVDNVIELELEGDSLADSVIFKLDKKEHEVKKYGGIVRVPLRKEFLAQQMSPAVSINSKPSTLDARLDITIRAARAPPIPNSCDPACFGNRDCIQTQDSYKCVCSPGYSGNDCAKISIDSPCSDAPCKNHGMCKEVTEDVNRRKYICICRSGFSGDHCEIFGMCQPNPCKNDGVCERTGEHFLCKCKPSFAGILCDDNKKLTGTAANLHYSSLVVMTTLLLTSIFI